MTSATSRLLRAFTSKCYLNRTSVTTTTTTTTTIALFAVFAATINPVAFGQQPSLIAQAPISADAILGFENIAAWQVSVTAGTSSVTLSGLRTQGASAYSLKNPGDQARLTSLPVSSAATQMANIGAPGATLAVDIRFPADKQSSNSGNLRLSITSPSRGLNRLPLGKVSFGNLRTGTFQTVSFPLTDQARKALAGAPFNDLTFELTLTTLGTGEYLLDNLRLRSIQGVTADANTKPPAGYGGSVDFDINLNLPLVAPVAQTLDANLGAPVAGTVEQTFDVGPMQVPDRFHLKSGTAGAGTSVKLDLGYSPASIIASCVYLPDTLDATQKSYLFSSCTGGPQPGDIVSASWARLQIVNGVPPMRIRAQIATRPLGDQMGSNIIPPMPTFWGDEDNCTAATPVSPQFLATSQNCTATVAQASKIVDDYFKKVTQANPAAGWIVSPDPEFAKRHGDITAVNALANAPFAKSRNAGLAGVSDAAPIDFFDSQHLNEGGLFDAYYVFISHLNYDSFPNTDRAKTHLDADFSLSGVVFGLDGTALRMQASADTDTGETKPDQLPASSHLTTRLYVFGIEEPEFHFDSPGAFSKTIPLFNSPPFDPIQLRFWVFKLSIGLKAEAGLTVTGGLLGSGIGIALVPEGSVEGHVFGGIDIFVLSGGVDASIDLLRVKLPVSASVGWTLDTSLARCNGTLAGALDADLTLSSGGGNVSLVASVGFCPICDTYALKIFGWKPISSTTVSIDHEDLGSTTFPLPTSLCPGVPATVTIQSPSSDFSTIYGAVDYSLAGLAYSNNQGAGFGLPINCSNFTWSVNPPDVITGTGCSAKIHFSNAAHVANVKLNVNHPFTDANGRSVSETGSASKPVTVSVLAPGVTITSVLNLDTRAEENFKPVLSSTSAPTPGGYILTGKFVLPVGVDAADVKYRWTVNHKGTITDITCNFSNLDGCVPDGLGFSLLKVYWVPLDLNDGFGYTVTLSAISKASGEAVGSDSFLAKFNNVL